MFDAISIFGSQQLVLLQIAHTRYKINKNIHVVAVGKAVIGMCHSVENIFGDHIVRGLAFVPENSVQSLQAAGKE